MNEGPQVQSISREDAKKIVNSIRGKIEGDKNTRAWDSLVNALNLVSQVVFTRSSGCVLELIQNAEDAGQDLASPGVFEVSINPARLKVAHNARPFSEADVNAICAINSSKKPERGTLGYLGIGFKSVFKITDQPEIYSGGFQFKFHRPDSNPDQTPWQIIPHWIEKPSENVDPEKTTFILPFRDEELYANVVADLEKLGIELFLFLRWLRKIEVLDESPGQRLSLASSGDEGGVTRILRGGQEHRFKIFRRTVHVPSWVRGDRLTQHYRANVTKRQIAVAFELDDQERLCLSDKSAGYGGVYSFVPLGEAKSGAKFAIQADFLVQPGRDAINYEAKWNEWLLGEVVNLCKEEVVPQFKQHEKWKFQILSSFEFHKSVGNESYERLFGPTLIQEIEEFIEKDACVPTRDGGWAMPSMAIIADEHEEALGALVSLELFSENEIAPAFAGQNNLKFAHASVEDRKRAPLKKAGRWQFFENVEYLHGKSKSAGSAKWFRALYCWLSSHPRMEQYRPYRAHYDRLRPKRYDNCEIILAADDSLHCGREVLVPNLGSADPVLLEAAKTLHEEKPVLHPDILFGNDTEVDKLKGFLTGLTGAQFLDAKTICRDAILPRIVTPAPKPNWEELVKLTRYCRQWLVPSDMGNQELWVLTSNNDVQPAKAVIFSSEYKPFENWEPCSRYVAGLEFLSPSYLESSAADDDLKSWRNFFVAAGVREHPDNSVEEFGMKYAMEQLREASGCCKTDDVHGRNLGYDVEAVMGDGRKIYVEVKGLSEERDIELTENETRTAHTHGGNYYLCVVAGIPNNANIHVLKDPYRKGKKDKLTIPAGEWQPCGSEIT